MSQPNPPVAGADDEDRRRRPRTWIAMFRDAMRGVKVAVRGEVNFFVHLFIAVLAGVGGGILKLSDEQWCLYILCVTVVLTAEMFNTAIEHLARAVTREEHPEVRNALDIASGAVLVAAIGASCVGVLMIAWPLTDVLRR
jgi:diacylglycerol kinase